MFRPDGNQLMHHEFGGNVSALFQWTSPFDTPRTRMRITEPSPLVPLLRTLRAVLLAGAWTPLGVEERLHAACLGVLKKTLWLKPLVRRLFAAYPESATPKRKALLKFLARDKRLLRSLEKLDPPPKFNLGAATAPRMSPVRDRFRQWQLPSLTSKLELAEWLGVTCAEVDWLTRSRRDRPVEKEHYRYRWIARPGRPRLFEIPRLRLKQAQRRLTALFALIPPHPAAHGFVAKRSAVSCLETHVGQQVVLRMDLQHFFPSIRRGRVTAMLREFGYPQLVAALIARLVTATVPPPILEEARPLCHEQSFELLQHSLGQPHLPQGAPTSPAVANLISWKLDCRLTGLAEYVGARYTRYADDLIFSGGQQFGRGLSQFREFVLAIALDEGFFIRHYKTRTMRRSGRQSAIGLVMNEKLNVPREDHEQLRAILHNCSRSGWESQNRDEHPDFLSHLRGRVAYIAATNPERGTKLAGMLERIKP